MTSAVRGRLRQPTHGSSNGTATARNAATTSTANSSQANGPAQRSRSSGARATHHSSHSVHGTHSAALASSERSTSGRTTGCPREASTATTCTVEMSPLRAHQPITPTTRSHGTLRMAGEARPRSPPPQPAPPRSSPVSTVSSQPRSRRAPAPLRWRRVSTVPEVAPMPCPRPARPIAVAARPAVRPAATAAWRPRRYARRREVTA